jgi:hypothetical protein
MVRWLWLLPAFMFAFVRSADAATATEPRDYSKLIDKDNVEFLRQLQRSISSQGYREVRVIPQFFVATAVGSDGRLRTLIIDYNTLKMFSFEGALPLDVRPGEDQKLRLH